MRSQWILNSSARLERFSQSQLAEAYGGLPDYVDAMGKAAGENSKGSPGSAS